MQSLKDPAQIRVITWSWLGKMDLSFLFPSTIFLLSESGIEAFTMALEARYAWLEDALKGTRQDGIWEKV